MYINTVPDGRLGVFGEFFRWAESSGSCLPCLRLRVCAAIAIATVGTFHSSAYARGKLCMYVRMHICIDACLYVFVRSDIYDNLDSTEF